MNYDHISQIGEDNATHAHRETFVERECSVLFSQASFDSLARRHSLGAVR